MSATDAHSASSDASVGKIDMKLEVAIIPVSDIERSKEFYERLGWRLDGDVPPLEGLRTAHFTPPGSGASVTFGMGITAAAPGAAEGGLTVTNIEAAHHEVVSRGIDVSDVWHGPPFPPEARQPGADPDRTSYGSFCCFNDPDGHISRAREFTTGRPGGVNAAGPAFASPADRESALRRAEAAHTEHEKRTGHRLKAELAERVQDQSWPAWYASYMVAEQTGTDLPT